MFSVTITRYVDGEIDGRRAGAVAHHVETCAHCRAEVEALARLKQRLRHQHAADAEALARLRGFAALLARGCR